jgi:glutamate synthase domain-containing protein 3
MRIDAKGMHYRELNELIYKAVNSGKKNIILDNINGQRYISDGLSGEVEITVNGVPGNDLASFMDGPTIIVNSNGQDGIGNTMNAGKIVVHGDVGDIAGHSMRGGRIYIKGNAGYRVGIHMKSYKDLYPVIIIGGTAGSFLGEYMAGGLIVVLGIGREEDASIVGSYCGTGMHGGAMYLRGDIKNYQLGNGVKKGKLAKEDEKTLNAYLEEYCAYFKLDRKKIMKDNFIKLAPSSHRPYEKLYAY